MSGIGIKFGAEGEKEFKRSLSEINQTFKLLGSEMKLVQSQFDKNDNSVEALTARNEALNKQIDAQKSKIATLKSALENAAESFGENDKRTNAWRIQLNNAEAALNGMERELKNNEDEIKKASSEFGTAEKAVDKFGDEVKETGKETDKAGDSFRKIGDVLKGIGKAIAASAAAIGASAVAASKKVWDMAKETAAAGDTVDKASQKFGLSAKSYQEWDYILSQSGADIESMGAGFKSLTNLVDKATSGNDAAIASFEKLGISTESLKDMSREDIFALTVKRLQEMEDTTGRAALANQLFGRSGQNLAPLLNQSAEATENLRKKANELGFVMSDEAVKASVNFTDSLDTLKRTFSGVKNSIVSNFLPGLTSITTGFSKLLAGNSNAKNEIKKGTDEIVKSLEESIPKAAEIISTIFETIGGVIIGALPELLELSQTLVTEIFTSLSESLPEILPVLFDTLFSLLDTLMTDGLPTLLESLMKVASSLLDSFLEKFPIFMTKLIEFIGNIDLGELLGQFLGAVEKIAAMIADNLPMIVNNLMNAVINLVKSIDWRDLMSSGFKIVLSLIDGILDAIPQLVDALPDLIVAIVEFLTDPETVTSLVKGGISLVAEVVTHLPEIFASLLQAVTDIGVNIVKGFWEGIKSMANWLWEKITGFFGGIVDGILGFFGIHSPSTLFRDKVGKNLALGIGVGFESEMDSVKKDMQNAIPTDFDAGIAVNPSFAGFNAYAGAGGAGFSGGNQITQYFNVSIAVDSINDEWDLNDLVTRVSEGIADQVRRTENVYA